MPLQLEGRVQEYVEDNHAQLVEENRQLHIKVRQLDEALRMERLSAEAARACVRELTRILDPFRRAIALIYGEIDLAGLTGEPSAPAARPSGSSPAWDTWKRKLGGKKAEVIEALESHPMSRDQVRVATSSGWSTVDAALAYLKSVGLIEKTGNKWSLKSL